MHNLNDKPVGVKPFIPYVRMKMLTRTLLTAMTMMLIYATVYKLSDGRQSNVAFAAVNQHQTAQTKPHKTLNRPGFYIKSLESKVEKHPEILSQFSAEDVLLVFKKPDMIKNEGPIALWQFRSDECVADFYFEDNGEVLAQTPVKHFEIRGHGANSLTSDPLECR